MFLAHSLLLIVCKNEGRPDGPAHHDFVAGREAPGFRILLLRRQHENVAEIVRLDEVFRMLAEEDAILDPRTGGKIGFPGAALAGQAI